MAFNVLLINSDLAKNRGDRAIAEGNIELIKQHFPNATITGLSQLPKRDKKWFGISFLDMNFQSLSPSDFRRLYKQAQKSDLILWGGGEILKDYTNKAALWYWVAKISLLARANPNIYGLYQGIGPTKSDFSKKLIVSVVKKCKGFIVRDKESYDKLVSWGAPAEKLRYSSDPAVLPSPQPISKELKEKLKETYDIDSAFLKDFICIGPRDWFHYKPGGVLPFKYKQKLYSIFGKQISTATPEHTKYLKQLAALISETTKRYNTNVLLVPMHMEEGDTDLCRFLKEHSKNPNAVRILDKDELSPSELRSVISKAKAMVGFRLHSNIVGISAGVPSINIYYVDKGRVFFDQIKQQHFARPIESVLKRSFVKDFSGLFDELFKKRASVKKNINTATNELRTSVTTTFSEVFDEKRR